LEDWRHKVVVLPESVPVGGTQGIEPFFKARPHVEEVRYFLDHGRRARFIAAPFEACGPATMDGSSTQIYWVRSFASGHGFLLLPMKTGEGRKYCRESFQSSSTLAGAEATAVLMKFCLGIVQS
jgi:hypothetical protein